MYPCAYREPGHGAMGQPLTMKTGDQMSHIIALAITGWGRLQIHNGMPVKVSTLGIMFVNCKHI